MRRLICLVAVLLAPLVAAAGDDERRAGDEVARLTPLGMRIDDAPVAVKGSDGRYHVVYEIELTNFTDGAVSVEKLEALDAGDDRVVAALDGAELAQRLQVRDRAAQPRGLGPAQGALLYLHLIFDSHSAVPRALQHRASLLLGAAPFVETAGRVRVHRPTDLLLDAPLRGPRYIAADGCCDSTRHIRATLPINGRRFTAQRFAIDWEQLDEQGRVFVGNPKDPASYIIYGKPVYAVADGRVVVAVDGLPDTPPGALPVGIPLEQADGNHVVLDLGDDRYAMFAHLKPNSVQVEKGQQVQRGQLLGFVGTSGNSSEPHLHLQVTDGKSTFASNGLPYLLRSFRASYRGVSTAAFDEAAATGRPLAIEPVPQPGPRHRVLPLDLWIVDLPQ